MTKIRKCAKVKSWLEHTALVNTHLMPLEYTMYSTDVRLLAAFFTDDQIIEIFGYAHWEVTALLAENRPRPRPHNLVELLREIRRMGDTMKDMVVPVDVQENDRVVEALARRIDACPENEFTSFAKAKLKERGYEFVWQLAVKSQEEICYAKPRLHRIVSYQIYSFLNDLKVKTYEKGLGEDDPRIQAARLITTGR